MDNIEYRCECKEKYHNIFRTIGVEYPEIDYISTKIQINCHDGQRKLLFSEIEFLTKIGHTYDLNNILCVYVGSAPGIHLPIIFDLFPELDFYLCDPHKFIIDHELIGKHDRLIIDNSFYDDETYQKINKYNIKHKQIAMISDIRTNTSEMEVIQNMVNQQKWTMQLNCIAYMLKFRLLYINKEMDIKLLTYSYPIPYESKSIKKSFVYLKGEIYTQLYPPNRSSETRLIYVRQPKEEFQLMEYDIYKYDRNLNYFNTFDRRLCYKYKFSTEIKKHIFYYDDGYESTCEYFILDDYLSNIKHIDPTLEKMVAILYKIDNEYRKISQKNLLLLPLIDMIVRIKRYDEEKKKYAIDMSCDYIELIFKSIKNQQKYLSKEIILKNYDHQLKLMSQTIKKMDELAYVISKTYKNK